MGHRAEARFPSRVPFRQGCCHPRFTFALEASFGRTKNGRRRCRDTLTFNIVYRSRLNKKVACRLFRFARPSSSGGGPRPTVRALHLISIVPFNLVDAQHGPPLILSPAVPYLSGLPHPCFERPSPALPTTQIVMPSSICDDLGGVIPLGQLSLLKRLSEGSMRSATQSTSSLSNNNAYRSGQNRKIACRLFPFFFWLARFVRTSIFSFCSSDLLARRSAIRVRAPLILDRSLFPARRDRSLSHRSSVRPPQPFRFATDGHHWPTYNTA